MTQPGTPTRALFGSSFNPVSPDALAGALAECRLENFTPTPVTNPVFAPDGLETSRETVNGYQASSSSSSSSSSDAALLNLVNGNEASSSGSNFADPQNFRCPLCRKRRGSDVEVTIHLNDGSCPLMKDKGESPGSLVINEPVNAGETSTEVPVPPPKATEEDASNPNFKGKRKVGDAPNKASEEIKCVLCLQILPSPKKLEKHYERKLCREMNRIIKWCQEKYNTKDLPAVLKMVKEEENKKKGQYDCKLCKFSPINSVEDMKLHFASCPVVLQREVEKLVAGLAAGNPCGPSPANEEKKEEEKKDEEKKKE